MTRKDTIYFFVAIIALAFALWMPGQPAARERIEKAATACKNDGFPAKDCHNQAKETN